MLSNTAHIDLRKEGLGVFIPQHCENTLDSTIDCFIIIGSDGNREPNAPLDLEVAGAGCLRIFQLMFSTTTDGGMRRTLMACSKVVHMFAGIAGPLETVQRAEYWGVVLALQGFSGIHVGIDNFNVVRCVTRLIDRGLEGTHTPCQGWRSVGRYPFHVDTHGRPDGQSLQSPGTCDPSYGR